MLLYHVLENFLTLTVLKLPRSAQNVWKNMLRPWPGTKTDLLRDICLTAVQSVKFVVLFQDIRS